MRTLPHLLLILLWTQNPLRAVDAPKDPDQAAVENIKQAKAMYEEAKNHADYAAKCEKEDADILSKFAQMTFEEAEWLQRSGEAFEKKQIRLAERYQQKAQELCEKRGKLGDKIAAIYQKKCDKPDSASPASKKDEAQSKADRLAEIEKKEAELAAEKKLILNKD